MNKGLFLVLLFTVVVNGYSQTAIWSTPPTYDSLEEYGNIYKIKENGKVGLADVSGEVLLAARYDSITPFYDHLALALEYDAGKYVIKGIVDDHNYRMVALKERFYMGFPVFTEGKLLVYDSSKRYGYLLPDGNLLKPCQYHKAFPFFEGFALIYKKDKEVTYLQNDGNEFVTDLERQGYILVHGTNFNEEGEAYVVGNDGTTREFCIINKQGRTVRKAKTMDGGRRAKNYKMRKSFSVQMPFNNLAGNPVNVIEKDGLFGYSDNQNRDILPPQFVEAAPFKGGFAKVKKGGKYGILKLQSGSFVGALDKKHLQVRNGRADSVHYSFSLPVELKGKPLIMFADDGRKKPIEVDLDMMANGEKGFSFLPDFQNEETEKVYELALWSEGILLWKDQQKITLEYVKSYPPVLSVPKIADGFEMDEDGFVRADSNNKVGVYAVIENRSSENLTITVMFGGDGVSDVSRELVVAPESSERISSFIIVKKRASLEVTVKTSTGLQQNGIIKVKPFI